MTLHSHLLHECIKFIYCCRFTPELFLLLFSFFASIVCLRLVLHTTTTKRHFWIQSHYIFTRWWFVPVHCWLLQCTIWRKLSITTYCERYVGSRMEALRPSRDCVHYLKSSCLSLTFSLFHHYSRHYIKPHMLIDTVTLDCSVDSGSIVTLCLYYIYSGFILLGRLFCIDLLFHLYIVKHLDLTFK